jgi:MFS family permease
MATANRKPAGATDNDTVFAVLIAISACHLINDMMQSLLPAIYPSLKASLGLNFGQIGLVTLAYQVTASILQPLIGLYADRRPTPLALPFGTLFSLAGLTVLSVAHAYGIVLLGASLLGMGSSVFHPESSRVARMAGAHATALPNRSSRLAATPVRRWVRSPPPSSLCIGASPASASLLYSRCCQARSCGMSDSGTSIMGWRDYNPAEWLRRACCPRAPLCAASRSCWH